MAKRKEFIHLNGSSQQFLSEFSVLKEKVMNHLEHSVSQDEKLDKIDKKIDSFIEIITKHQVYFKLVGSLVLLTLGGIVTWVVTHYA